MVEVVGDREERLSQGWRLERVFDGEQTQVGNAEVAREGAWGTSRSQGQKALVVVVYDSIEGQKNGKEDGGVEEIAQFRGDGEREVVDQMIGTMVDNGCHGKKYRTGRNLQTNT